ncbi:MAG: hypothetical protein ACWA6X_06690 [Bauldia sp.]
MARRPSRSSLVRVLIGDAPAAPALSLYAILLGMAVPAVLPFTGAVDAPAAAAALIALAAILLAFLAGVRFARAVAGSPRLAIAATGAALAGFAASFLPAGLALLVLAVLHAALGVWDVWSADGVRLPGWYAGLRARTAPLAVAILVLAFFSGA